MKLLLLYALIFGSLLLNSCSKLVGEKKTKMSIEGFVRDQYNATPVAGVTISVTAIKPSSGGVGLNLDSKSEMVGNAVTDASGYYKLNMNVFEAATRLDIYATYGFRKVGYTDFGAALQLSALNRTGSNHQDFLMTPSATLQIKYKNANPVAATDTFSFGYYNLRFPVTMYVLDTSNCGTIPNKSGYWIGRDVCGQYSIIASAEQKCTVYWNVRKNGTRIDYRDSIFVPRGSTTVYNINY
jgi:hypothetical protein